MRTRLKNYLTMSKVVELLPLRSICDPRDSLREDLGQVQELASSIKRMGLIEPIVVRPTGSKFEIVAGQRRTAACRLNGMSEIPAIVVELSDKEAFELALEENFQRKTLDPIEEARAFKVYVDRYGYGSTTELAGKIGVSEEYVSHRIMLLKLPMEIQEEIRRRLLSSSIGWEITRVKGEESQKKIAEAAVEKQLTVKQLRLAASLSKLDMPATQIVRKIENKESLEEMHVDDEKGGRRKEKVRKAAILLLRVTLIKLDDLIRSLSDDEAPLRDEVTTLRYSLHQLIDKELASSHSDRTVKEITTFVKQNIIGALNTKDFRSLALTKHPKFFTSFAYRGTALESYGGWQSRVKTFLESASSSKYSMESLGVRSFGEFAIASFMCNIEINGRRMNLRGRARVSLTLARIAQDWKVIHEHWSTVSDVGTPSKRRASSLREAISK